MSKRAKKNMKAKAANPKTFKTLKSAARTLKAKAKKSVRVTRGKGGKIKLDRTTPSQPDAMAKRLAPPVMEHPKGFPPRPANTRWLDEIKVGKRHRKDFGNLDDLAGSIDARGELLQSIAIQPDNMLIAGERRMKAWPLTIFNDRPIPVRVITVDSIIAGEWDENAKRKDFTPTEAAKISEEIERQLAAMAKQRQRAGTKADPKQKGETSEVAARATGLARRTIDKAKAVVKAAEADPERFGKLQRDMDKSGKVDGPFKRLQIMQQKDAINTAPAPLPMRGPYNAIVVDHAWPAEKDADQATIDRRGRAMRDYPEMSIEEGKKLYRSKEFQALLAPDCRVYFWTTNHHMDAAFELLRAMGFDKHSTIGTWTKNKMGNGQVLRGKTEHCILAERGKPVTDIQKPDGGHWTTDWSGEGWEVREDSRKPDAFFDLVEHHTPSPRYAEIFSRGGRNEKWDCHGDQAGKFAPSIAKEAQAAIMAEVQLTPDQQLLRVLEAIEKGEAPDLRLVSPDVAKRLDELISGKKTFKLNRAGKVEIEFLRQAAADYAHDQDAGLANSLACEPAPAVRPKRFRFVKGSDNRATSMAINGLPFKNIAKISNWANPYDQQPGETTPAQRVELYRDMLKDKDSRRGEWIRSHVSGLRGFNLACDCEADQPCHHDVLIELANPEFFAASNETAMPPAGDRSEMAEATGASAEAGPAPVAAGGENMPETPAFLRRNADNSVSTSEAAE